MNQHNSIKGSTIDNERSDTIYRAEAAVTQSIEKFERAMQHLAERVEENRIRIEHAVESVNNAKEDVLRIKDSVASSIDPIRPYLRSASNAYSSAKSNPTPFLFGLIGIAGGLLLYAYFRSQKETQVFDTTLDVHPTYQ